MFNILRFSSSLLTQPQCFWMRGAARSYILRNQPKQIMKASVLTLTNSYNAGDSESWETYALYQELLYIPDFTLLISSYIRYIHLAFPLPSLLLRSTSLARNSSRYMAIGAASLATVLCWWTMSNVLLAVFALHSFLQKLPRKLLPTLDQPFVSLDTFGCLAS